MDTLEYKFEAKVQQSSGRKATYFFVLVPEGESNHITHFSSHLMRGFKSLKVDVAAKKAEGKAGEKAGEKAGKEATWRSSIFPSDGKYLLLLNKEARKTAALDTDDKVQITLTILDL
ncbi:MAG: DUF1905 domain-containing protein [Alphaproteobacteria bacterium]|nr:DUF1905 domain-containing protein [Alphaproteobacteria bacterium]